MPWAEKNQNSALRNDAGHFELEEPTITQTSGGDRVRIKRRGSGDVSSRRERWTESSATRTQINDLALERLRSWEIGSGQVAWRKERWCEGRTKARFAGAILSELKERPSSGAVLLLSDGKLLPSSERVEEGRLECV